MFKAMLETALSKRFSDITFTVLPLSLVRPIMHKYVWIHTWEKFKSVSVIS